MVTRIGINGFGRIGRQSLKALIERAPDVEVVAINDLVEPELDALLFKHDSTYGTFPGEVSYAHDRLVMDGREIRVLREDGSRRSRGATWGSTSSWSRPGAASGPNRPGRTWPTALAR